MTNFKYNKTYDKLHKNKTDDNLHIKQNLDYFSCFICIGEGKYLLDNKWFVISFVLCGVCHQVCVMWRLSSVLFYVEFVISFVLCGVCQKTFPMQNKKYLYYEACLNQIILMHYWFCQFCVVHSSPGLFIPYTFTLLVVIAIGNDYIGSCRSNYQMMTTRT
jgi:predicted metal-binding protein